MKKLLQKIGKQAKYPTIYAGTFSALTGVTEGLREIVSGENLVQSLETMTKTTVENLPFFAIVNTCYAKGIDLMTERFGRIGANLLCLAVNAGFAGYTYFCGDKDPSYQALVTTAVGLYLTNNQVNDIQRIIDKKITEGG